MASKDERERQHPLVPKKVLRQIRRILQATGITKAELGRRIGGTRNTITLLMKPERTHRPSTSAPIFAEINRIYRETFPPKPTEPTPRESAILGLRPRTVEIVRSFNRTAEIEELEAAAAAIMARIQNAKNAAEVERKDRANAKFKAQAAERIPAGLAEDLLRLTSNVSEIGKSIEALTSRIGTLAARLDDGQVRIEVAVASVEEQVEKLLSPFGRDSLFSPVNGATP